MSCFVLSIEFSNIKCTNTIYPAYFMIQISGIWIINQHSVDPMLFMFFLVSLLSCIWSLYFYYFSFVRVIEGLVSTSIIVLAISYIDSTVRDSFLILLLNISTWVASFRIVNVFKHYKLSLLIKLSRFCFWGSFIVWKVFRWVLSHAKGSLGGNNGSQVSITFRM